MGKEPLTGLISPTVFVWAAKWLIRVHIDSTIIAPGIYLPILGIYGIKNIAKNDKTAIIII